MSSLGVPHTHLGQSNGRLRLIDLTPRLAFSESMLLSAARQEERQLPGA
jgi:hypothetical protein